MESDWHKSKIGYLCDKKRLLTTGFMSALRDLAIDDPEDEYIEQMGLRTRFMMPDAYIVKKEIMEVHCYEVESHCHLNKKRLDKYVTLAWILDIIGYQVFIHVYSRTNTGSVINPFHLARNE